MSFKDVQEQADAFTAQFIPQYWKPHEILARLIEEVGELAREVNHLYGPKKKKSSEEIKELRSEMQTYCLRYAALLIRRKLIWILHGMK